MFQPSKTTEKIPDSETRVECPSAWVGGDEWEKEFDKKFCRKSKNKNSYGETRDFWFFPDTITPKEIKSFIAKLLAKKK